MSPFDFLPPELIIGIAAQLDAHSLLDFKSTCKVFRDIVRQTPCLKYALALAARGLSDGPPSPVTVASRLALVKRYEEAWRTLSWSEHLTLDLPHPHQAPYVSGGSLVLPIRDNSAEGSVRSFLVQSIPSRLRGVPGQQWQIDFDFFVKPFIIDATQDLLAVVPLHDPKNVLVCALSTGQPHPLSANGGVLRLEGSRRPWLGNSKHEFCGDFLGMTTWSCDALDDRLLIWNWKTGILHANTPIRVGSLYDAVFSFLDDHHFVVPSVLDERPSDIVLNVYQLCHHRRHPCGPQQQPQETPAIVRRYVLSVAADALTDVRALRFFPDVSARGGASPGYFYADESKRAFGIQFEATSLKTKRETVQELLVPLRVLMAPEQEQEQSSSSSPAPAPYRCASVGYEPYLGRRLAYASREGERTGTCVGSVPAEKLPLALRGVDAGRLRFAVCCGALLVFEHAGEDPGPPTKLHILAF